MNKVKFYLNYYQSSSNSSQASHFSQEKYIFSVSASAPVFALNNMDKKTRINVNVCVCVCVPIDSNSNSNIKQI